MSVPVTPNAFDIREWAVVSGGMTRFLGRPFTGKQDVMDAVNSGGFVRLDPTFEFVATLQRDQAGRTTREPIICPVDFVVFGVPLYVKPTAIYFCTDMTPEDQATYAKLVEQGLATMTRARASRAGIALVQDVPTGAIKTSSRQ